MNHDSEIAAIDVAAASPRLSAVVAATLIAVPMLATVLFGGVDTTTWIFISAAWAAMLLLWLIQCWKAGTIFYNRSSIQLPLLGLVMIGIVQLLPIGGGGVEAGVAVSRALSLDPYSTRFLLVRLVVYLGFFAACLTFVRSGERIRKTVIAIVIFGAVMAFYGILQRLGNPDGIYGVRATPQAIPFGPFVNQHHFAAFMIMTGALSFAMLLSRDVVREKKVLYGTALVIMGSAVLLTSSRGGLLGFITMLALVSAASYLTGRWHKGTGRNETRGLSGKLVIAAGGMAVVAVVVGLVIFLGGNQELLRGIGAGNTGADITTGRSHFWPVAISIFLDHPVIGAGLDSFGVAYTRYDTWNGLLRVEQAHNEYLQTLADTGLAGFLCVAAFIFLFFKKGLSSVSRSTGLLRDHVIGALAGCFGIMVHSFFDFPLRTPSNAFFFLLLASIAVVNGGRADRAARS